MAAINDHPLDFPTLQINNDNQFPNSKNWSTSVSANAGDQISFLVYYHNNSTVTAQNVRIKLAPQISGSKNIHSFTATISSDNFPTVSGTVTVNISQSKPMQFIPGSLRWFPNQCGSTSCTQALPFGQNETAIFSSSGLLLGNIVPGFVSQGSVRLFYVIEAERAELPSVSLSASPTSITQGDSSVLSWTSSNSVSCTASGGWSGSKSLSGSQTVSPGTNTTFTLTCLNAEGAQASKSVTVNVNQPPAAPTVDLTADRTTINQGESFTLSWTSSNANSCFASNGWSGTKSLTGSQIITSSFTKTYTLTCSNSAGAQASDSVAVTVQSLPFPTVDLTVNPGVIQQGNSAVLSWTSTNADFCTASGGWSGTKSTFGSETVSPTTNANFTLTCFNSQGQVSDSVSLSVIAQPLPTVSLTANPGSVTQGNSSVLIWNTSNADTCTASGGWSGTKTLQGSETVTPSINTTFTLTCSNARGQASDSVTVFVNQLQNFPTVNLTANPTSINQGNSSVLSWSSSNADTCTASGGWSGSKSLSGSQTVTPSVNTTFTITCFNSRGQASDSVTVFVNQVQNVSVSLSANPTTITQGNSSVLSWSSNNAVSCSASGGWSGNKNLSGSETVTPGVNTSFTLTCQNSSGQTDTESVTVFVTQLQNFPTVNLTANPTSITQGNSSVLSWSSSNADTCTASGGWSGSKSLSGSQTVTPSVNTTFTITCFNSRGQASDSVTVFVNQVQATPTLVFRAIPSVITRGDASSLSWTSDNTTSCIAGGGWSGNKAVSGSQSVNPQVQTNYTLTCFGPGGSVTTEALVTVIAPVIQPSVLGASCGVSDTSVLTGESMVFSAAQSGGRAPYTYSWSGAIQGSGVSRTVSFNTTGTKTANVIITDVDGRTASGSCTTSVSARTTPPPPPPGEVLGAETPTCEVRKALACTDGKIYLIDVQGNAYDKNGKLIYSGFTDGSATTTPSDTSNGTSNDTSNKERGKVAALFLTNTGGLTGLGFLLMWYFLILLAIGFAVLMYRLIKGKNVNY